MQIDDVDIMLCLKRLNESQLLSYKYLLLLSVVVSGKCQIIQLFVRLVLVNGVLRLHSSPVTNLLQTVLWRKKFNFYTVSWCQNCKVFNYLEMCLFINYLVHGNHAKIYYVCYNMIVKCQHHKLYQLCSVL